MSRNPSVLITGTSGEIGHGLIGRLPPAVTHVTFDPSPRFHRRYPVDVIRACLDLTASDV